MARVRTKDTFQLSLYLQLGKFRLCLLVLFTTLIGYGLGVTHFRPLEIFCLLSGTLLTAMGANGQNQWWEQARDALMARTHNRPLPSGRMSSQHAFVATYIWLISGLLILFYGVNALTAYLALATIIIYLFIYTPLKPFSSVAVLVGAIPGAIPPMMGWTAATNSFSIEAWVLGCLLFLWQIPHFMSLAAIYRKDYANGGYKLLPDNPETDTVTRSIIVIFSGALLGISLLIPAVGLGRHVIFGGALILGLGMLFLAIILYREYSLINARRVFLGSIVYLPLLLTLLLVDERLLRHFWSL
ncbi:MAG: protoheme IX farnesyltransferase [Paraglaciecola sp.]|jgi:protoheme IX farnesyltransferase